MELVDSPLLQRLRGIKQLGFTSYTYPSAEHSRFTHSLGVAHIVKQLLRSVDETARKYGSFSAGGTEYRFYDTSQKPAVRRSLTHAALLHDTGHLAFSHASEVALVTHSEHFRIGSMHLEEFIQIFRDTEIRSELSECISVALCLSPRFQEFYRRATGIAEPLQPILEICSFITGTPHDRAYPGLCNLISGAAVDADKIDYINRDAALCGIPIGVDVSRIFLNTALVSLEKDQAETISKATRSDMRRPRVASGVHFLVNSAGIDTYDEIATSKAILYNRVYLHQLTRNAEQMLAECLRRYGASRRGGYDVLDLFPFRDQQLLDVLLQRSATKSIAARISNRQLPKRALLLYRDAYEPLFRISDVFDEQQWAEFEPTTTLNDMDTQLSRDTAWRVWSDLIPADPFLGPEAVKTLIATTRELAIDARRLLEPSYDFDNLPRSEPYIGYAQRYVPKPVPEVLVRQKNSIGTSAQWTKSEELTAADAISKGTDYVYAENGWDRFVRIAALKYLADAGSRLAPRAIEDQPAQDAELDRAEYRALPTFCLNLEDICSRVNVDYDRLVTDLHKVAALGFFGEQHRLVPLYHSQLTKCEELVRKFTSFMGERGWSVSLRSLVGFVRQFPVRLRTELIGMLSEVEVLARGKSYSGIRTIVNKLEGEEPSHLLFCRFSPNSGNYIGMLFEADARQEMLVRGHDFARSISEAWAKIDAAQVRGEDLRLVFLDDQFATGSQARAQLFHWAAKGKEEWPADLLSEQNIDLSPVTKEFREFMMRGKPVLAFVYGTAAGAEAIQGDASVLGFAGLTVEFSETIPSKASRMSAELRQFLESVGVQLLNYCRHGGGSIAQSVNSELIKDALGYGGGASLVTTPNNVPSHAVTALWCPGIVNCQPWVPLLLRRGYRKHLVFG